MEARTSSTDPNHASASLIEVVAINIAWLCGLSGFAAGLVTQRNGLALQGLALFFATFFYTLVRAYHFRRTDQDVVRIVHVDRRVTDPNSWVDYVPKSVSVR